MKRSALLLVISIAALGYNGDRVKRLNLNSISGAELIQIGDEAPSFVLPQLDGEDLSLETLLQDNHLVLLNFWATWCPFCWIEMLELEKIRRKYGPEGLEILAIAVDEPDSVRTHAEMEPQSYLIALDPDATVAGRYGVDALPTSILVGRDGTVLRTSQGLTVDLEEQLAAFMETAAEK
jgi:peroxiredoxin